MLTQFSLQKNTPYRNLIEALQLCLTEHECVTTFEKNKVLKKFKEKMISSGRNKGFKIPINSNWQIILPSEASHTPCYTKVSVLEFAQHYKADKIIDYLNRHHSPNAQSSILNSSKPLKP